MPVSSAFSRPAAPFVWGARVGLGCQGNMESRGVEMREPRALRNYKNKRYSPGLLLLLPPEPQWLASMGANQPEPSGS